MSNHDQANVVVGQKHAFATASLILGIMSFVHFLGMEKAILAIVFGVLALKSSPPPALCERRGWAKAGLILGSLMLVIVPAVLLANLNRIQLVIDTLMKLQNAK